MGSRDDPLSLSIGKSVSLPYTDLLLLLVPSANISQTSLLEINLNSKGIYSQIGKSRNCVVPLINFSIEKPHRNYFNKKFDIKIEK